MLPLIGNISTTLDTIYRPDSGKIGYIDNIKITNSSDSDWTIEIYFVQSLKSVLLYKYELLSGDTFNDTTNYKIPQNCSLQAKSTAETVNYVINGNEV